jgi:hypothetical protein
MGFIKWGWYGGWVGFTCLKAPPHTEDAFVNFGPSTILIKKNPSILFVGGNPNFLTYTLWLE